MSGFRTSRARVLHARLCQLDYDHAAHETAARPQVDCLVVMEPFLGGSTALTAQDSSMLRSVTQTPARLADSSLLAMGSASWAGFFCVSRNLVCTGRGLQRARRLAFNEKGRGKRLSGLQSPSPFFAFFSTGVLQSAYTDHVLHTHANVWTPYTTQKGPSISQLHVIHQKHAGCELLLNVC